jgi:hypothetical protein
MVTNEALDEARHQMEALAANDPVLRDQMDRANLLFEQEKSGLPSGEGQPHGGADKGPGDE